MSIGVKQGGILSAILFMLYLDKLLIQLKKSNIGCSINGNPTFAPPRIFAPPPSFATLPTFAPRKYAPPTFARPPIKNNKQRLRFNNITSIVIKSRYKDAKDEMYYALINKW